MMTQCHWCKCEFPESQVSSVEVYADDGRLMNVLFACDNCLDTVFPVATYADDPHLDRGTEESH